ETCLSTVITQKIRLEEDGEETRDTSVEKTERERRLLRERSLSRELPSTKTFPEETRIQIHVSHSREDSRERSPWRRFGRSYKDRDESQRSGARKREVPRRIRENYEVKRRIGT